MDTSDPTIAKGSDFCDGLVEYVAKSITDAKEVSVEAWTYAINDGSGRACILPGLVPMGAFPIENFRYIIALNSARIAASSMAEIVVSPKVDCEISPDSATVSVFFTDLPIISFPRRWR